MAGAALVSASVAPAALRAGRCGPKTCNADVSVSGHAEPQPIHPGEVTRLRLTPKNNGYDGALKIDLHVAIPAEGLRIVKVRRYGGNRCRWKQGFVRCDLGDFAREQEAVVVVYVKGVKRGTWITRAKVYSSDVVDPNGGNNHVEISVAVKRRS